MTIEAGVFPEDVAELHSLIAEKDLLINELSIRAMTAEPYQSR